MVSLEPTGQREQELLVLLKEYEKISADIRAIEGQNDKIVGIGLTIIGAGAAFGLQQKLVEVFVVLPFIFNAVFFYALLQYHNIFWLRGYKLALEERINAVVRTPVLVWERVVDSKRKRVNVANLPLVAIYVLLLIATDTYGIFRISEALGVVAGIVEAVAIIAFLVGLIFSIRSVFRGFSEAYHAARTMGLSIDEAEKGHGTSSR